MLPTLFFLALLCAPIAGVLVWGSNKVRQLALTGLPTRADLGPVLLPLQKVTTFELDYTECDTRSSTLEEMPKGKWDCELQSAGFGVWRLAGDHVGPLSDASFP